MNIIYLTILSFFLGCFIASIFLIFGMQLIKKFLKNAKLIRNYWIFVIVFAILNIAIYVIIFNSHISDKNLAVSVANQGSGLIFAIFTGYFAFSEVMEGRFEKLTTKAMRELRSKNYTDAVKLWESAISIKPKDHVVLANLIEAYIIQGKNTLAEEYLPLLTKIEPPEMDEIPLILTVTLNLFKRHIAEAETTITLLVTKIKAKERAAYYSRWDFRDSGACPAYLALTGDPKKLFDNTSRYVQNTLTEEERVKFESGNYLIS